MHQLTLDDIAAAAQAPDIVELWQHDPWHAAGGEWVEVTVTHRHRWGVEGWYVHVWRNMCESRRAHLPYELRGSCWRETRDPPPMHGGTGEDD